MEVDLYIMTNGRCSHCAHLVSSSFLLSDILSSLVTGACRRSVLFIVQKDPFSFFTSG